MKSIRILEHTDSAINEKYQRLDEPLPTPERSALMARVKGKNTKPEIIVRRLLHSYGFRYRLHRRDLPGTPDIAFMSRKKAVFVHGCFWHRHEGCSRCTTPKIRGPFWSEKFKANLERDRRKLTELAARGWESLVIWECETIDLERLLDRLSCFLHSR